MKEKTKKIVKRLSIIGGAIVSVLIVLAIVLSLTACSLKNSEQENGANAYPNVNAQLGLGPNVLFTFSETTVNEETNSVSKTITATVLPEDAPDKSVDWAIHWSTNNEGDDAVLSDYISLTPLEDGSNVATVTCYKGFEGSTFMIWVKTRVGGFAKNCIVRYDGAPETFEVGFNGESYNTFTTFDLIAGQSYDFELLMQNTLGQVGSKYSNFEIENISMSGRFVAIKQEHVNGPVVSEEEVVIDLSTGKAGDLDIPVSHFLDASIDNNILKVNVFRSEQSFRFPDVDAVRTGTQYIYKAPYTSALTGGAPEDCFIDIIIKETTSDMSIYVRIDLNSTVQSVSLSDSEITF